MSFKLLGGGSDLNGVVSDMNQNILELKGREVTEVFKDDTGVRRVLSGKRGDDYGLFVSKPTFDVFTAADDELIFNSGQNVFKIVDSGTTEIANHTLTTGANQYGSMQSSSQITHNLGYTPVVIAFGLGSGGVSHVPLPRIFAASVGTGAFTQVSYDFSVDDTYLEFFLNSFGYNDSRTITGFTVKYYLLQESAN